MKKALLFFLISIYSVGKLIACISTVLPKSNVSDTTFFVQTNDARLATSLYYPTTHAKNITLIVVHGAKKFDRQYYTPLATKFIQMGFHVVLFDKRGTGESTGKYKDVNVKSSLEAFPDLALDLAYVCHHVNKINGIQNNKIGLLATSQGGWIFPIVLKEKNNIDFVISLSGPTVSIDQESLYSKLTGDEKPNQDYKPDVDIKKISDQVKFLTESKGYDPQNDILKITIPVLWIYGAKDLSVPALLCEEKIRFYQGTHAKINFSVYTFPDANHSLINIHTNKAENYLPVIEDWLISNHLTK